MDRFDLYKDIAQRTQGEIYIGVVGPVRTGKSTFIKKFAEMMVLPQLDNPFKRERLIDEMPQSGAGRMIMTTQPHFVPNEAAELNLDGAKVKVRLIDCVGYLVDGATGHMEGDGPRMVRTPWYDYDVPFVEAAEIGTRKVIAEHSTIGVVVTTDATITDIPRSSYILSEERVVRELKELGKPFIIVLNSATPGAEDSMKLQKAMEQKYSVPVALVNVMEITAEQMEQLLTDILYEFPLKEVKITLPDWVMALSDGHWLLEDVLGNVMSATSGMKKYRDYTMMLDCLGTSEFLEEPKVGALSLGEGCAEITAAPRKDLFYRILGDECGYPIEGDYHLVTIIKDLVASKREYDRVAEALEAVRDTGYGLVAPSMSELKLEEPEIVRQGGRFGVRLKASAPSLHLIKVDIETEVNPIVGSEKQSEDLLNYLLSEFENNPSEIWNTNIFGKSLHDLVREGLANKLTKMPEEVQNKMQMTMQRIINEGRNNLICIVF